jgi:hypothetical protein
LRRAPVNVVTWCRIKDHQHSRRPQVVQFGPLFPTLYPFGSSRSLSSRFSDLDAQSNEDRESSEAAGQPVDRNKALVDAIAGEYMGADKKRGRVYTWLPLHLADSREETSPRTFLTAWREAALHEPAPANQAVDHQALLRALGRPRRTG